LPRVNGNTTFVRWGDQPGVRRRSDAFGNEQTKRHRPAAR